MLGLCVLGCACVGAVRVGAVCVRALLLRLCCWGCVVGAVCWGCVLGLCLGAVCWGCAFESKRRLKLDLQFRDEHVSPRPDLEHLLRLDRLELDHELVVAEHLLVGAARLQKSRADGSLAVERRGVGADGRLCGDVGWLSLRAHRGRALRHRADLGEGERSAACTLPPLRTEDTESFDLFRSTFT